MKLGELEVKMVSVDALRPNAWNPNEMDREMFERERASIRKHGFFDPVLVRAEPGTTPYEIIDGYHRWLAAKQEGLPEIPIVDYGTVPDLKAKELTILANELRGRSEPMKLAQVIADLVAGCADPAELLRTLPYRQAEVESMVQSVKAFDWTEAGSLRQRGGKDKNESGDKPFQLGALKGTIPPDLCEALLALYSRTADEEKSRTPEVVLRRWLTRLGAEREAA